MKNCNVTLTLPVKCPSNYIVSVVMDTLTILHVKVLVTIGAILKCDRHFWRTRWHWRYVETDHKCNATIRKREDKIMFNEAFGFILHKLIWGILRYPHGSSIRNNSLAFTVSFQYQKVLNKSITSMKEVFEDFENDDWEEVSGER